VAVRECVETLATKTPMFYHYQQQQQQQQQKKKKKMNVKIQIVVGSDNE
jgi:hypothetical protein